MKFFSKLKEKKAIKKNLQIEANYYKTLYQNSLGNKFAGPKSVSTNNYTSLRGLDYEDLQERANVAIWDSIQGRSLIKQLRALTINTGLKLQSMPERNILNLTPEQAQEWANKTESNFKMWRKLKESDYEERNNFNQTEGIVFLCLATLGEFFAILRYSDETNRVNPLQTQVIPPFMVQQPDFNQVEKAKSKGNRIESGIELDKKNREIAIYIFIEGETDPNKQFLRIPVKDEKTGLKIVLHDFVNEEPGQVRGVPFIAPIIHELSKITDLELAELDSAAANASIGGAIQRTEDVVKNQKLSDMGSGGFFPDSAEIVEAEAAGDKPAKYEERQITRGGFWLQGLEKGEVLNTIDTKRPNLNIPAMIDKIMEYAAPAAVGLPLEVVKMLFGQNYSASKGALDLAWRNIQFMILNFSSDFEQEIYKAWMIGEIATGRIIAPGFENPVINAAWTNSKWTGLPIPSLNPFVETKAAELRAKNGFSNREEESQNLTGTSYDNNIERLKQENKSLKEANEPLEKQENIEI